MNTREDVPESLGPCEAQDEFELMELADGALPPERARVLHAHLAGCVRCRRRYEAFATVDASLAASLPQPALSAGFDRALRERIAALPRTEKSRSDARIAAEREHERELHDLRDGLGRRTALDALVTATVFGSLAFAFETMAPTVFASLGFGGLDTDTTKQALLAISVGIAGLGVAFARRPTELLGLLAR